MPEGVDASGLYLALLKLAGEEKAQSWWRWMRVEHRQWAMEGWARLDAARKACAG